MYNKNLWKFTINYISCITILSINAFLLIQFIKFNFLILIKIFVIYLFCIIIKYFIFSKLGSIVFCSCVYIFNCNSFSFMKYNYHITSIIMINYTLKSSNTGSEKRKKEKLVSWTIINYKLSFFNIKITSYSLKMVLKILKFYF